MLKPFEKWFDSYRRCTCGHIAAMHSVDEMHACRSSWCGCEGFMPKPANELTWRLVLVYHETMMFTTSIQASLLARGWSEPAQGAYG